MSIERVSNMLETAVPFTLAEARAHTEATKATGMLLCERIAEAYDRRAWDAMCYESFAEYCEVELDLSKSRGYQLLAKARVIDAIVAGGGLPSDVADITARDVDILKGDLPALTEAVEEAIEEARSDQARPAAVQEAVRDAAEAAERQQRAAAERTRRLREDEIASEPKAPEASDADERGGDPEPGKSAPQEPPRSSDKPEPPAYRVNQKARSTIASALVVIQDGRAVIGNAENQDDIQDWVTFAHVMQGVADQIIAAAKHPKLRVMKGA